MIVIIADDLTGASDTGVQFKKNGFSTFVKVTYNGITADEHFDSYDVLSINADSRAIDSNESYNRIFNLTKLISNLNVDYIYKKIDSIMRGNPAPELSAVIDATEAEIAIVAPAFPENGRIIENGMLRMPDNTKVNIVNLFSEETKRKTSGIYIDEIRKGSDYIYNYINSLKNDGTEIFVLDTITDDDLAIINKAVEKMNCKKVLCGSAGFAKHLCCNKHDIKNIDIPKSNGITLAAIASRSKETAAQVKKAAEKFNAPIILVESDEIRERDYKKAISDAIENLNKAVAEGNKLIFVAIDSLFEEFSIVLRNTAEEYEKSLKIALSMGTIVKEFYKNNDVCALITTGGDMSLQTCSSLGASGIELYDEITAGVPVGKIIGGDASGTAIVTKSGGFGDNETLVKVVEYLNKNIIK